MGEILNGLTAAARAKIVAEVQQFKESSFLKMPENLRNAIMDELEEDEANPSDTKSKDVSPAIKHFTAENNKGANTNLQPGTSNVNSAIKAFAAKNVKEGVGSGK